MAAGVLRLGKHYCILPLKWSYPWGAPRVPGHCFQLWQTQPHFGEVLCKRSAVKSCTFIGHLVDSILFLSCFLCVNITVYIMNKLCVFKNKF